jgi:hypothetical protein
VFKSRPRRRIRELVLDGLFVAWVAQVLATGQLLPPQLTALLRDDAPIVAVAEELEAPQKLEEAPQLLPET